jgi:hypothetical protein
MAKVGALNMRNIAAMPDNAGGTQTTYASLLTLFVRLKFPYYCTLSTSIAHGRRTRAAVWQRGK